MILDALCIFASGYLAVYLSYLWSYGTVAADEHSSAASIFFVVVLNNYVMGKFHMYSDRIMSSLSVVATVSEAIFVDFTVLSTGILLLDEFQSSKKFFILFAVLSLISILLLRMAERWCIEKMFKARFNLRKILIIGNKKRGSLVADILKNQISWGHEIVGRLTTDPEETSGDDVLGRADMLAEIFKTNPVDEVVFASSGDRNFNLAKYTKLCTDMGKTVKILPSLWNSKINLFVEINQNVPFITIQSNKFNATGLLYKRILDLTGGIVGTLLLGVMYPFVAIAIKLDSEGSVLFKQKRVGQNGRIFDLYKFRTMCKGAEAMKAKMMDSNEMSGAIFKMKEDPRVTKVGGFLRKTSLDEFPQFLNVLKGEMSLVGTRPPTLDEVEEYRPDHSKRISAKPGITGLWQVSGRNTITDFEEIVKLDCIYLDNWRFLHDIIILFKTLVIVLQRKGAR